MPTIWLILLIVVNLLLLALYIYLKLLPKGAMGEFVVKLLLLALSNKTYTKIHDFTFKDGEKTVQIDHLIISKYGIFVVETKNYSGTIYGNENASHFYKYNHGKKFEFYNPIKQNFGHIFALKNVLGEYKYVSVVVFTGLGKLKIQSQSFVGYIAGLSKYIKSFKEELYTKEQVAEILNKLQTIRLKGRSVIKEHVQSIQARLREYDEKVSNFICPKCNGKLSLIQGKYGQFLGCSNYPKCNFRKKIE